MVLPFSAYLTVYGIAGGIFSFPVAGCAINHHNGKFNPGL
jgi:hypothetical protein